MDLYLEIAGDQIDGARDYQEDAFLTTFLDDDSGDAKSSGLVIMADGMGGHAAGNIASNLVVSTFNKTFTGRFGKDEPAAVLREALDKANGALSASIKETSALDGMGCTMVTAAFGKGRVNWISVGDSHLYLIRDRELIKKNEDHSYGGYLDRMKAQGMDIEPEAGLSRNMLMSAMTGDEVAEIDCPNKGLQLLAGDRIIIASDGLDTLSTGTIIQTSAWSQTAKECVAAMLKAVEEANKPRQDNTTVIVVDVREREAEEVPAAQAPAVADDMGGDTQPLPVVETDLEEEYEYEDEGGGKKGLIIGIAAALVLALGGGGYFMLGGGKEAAPPSQVAEVRPESVPEAAAESPSAQQPDTVESQPEPAAQPQAETQAVATPAFEELRDQLKSGGQGPVMVRLLGGSFEMGTGGLSVSRNEQPQRTVSVKSFAMSRYEITFEQYEVFAQATGRKAPDNLYLDKDVHPVLFVNWDDAYAFTQWLSQETGQRYRLPSEAEWEYAARGGTKTPYWWGYDIGKNRAHCFDCKTGLNPRQPTKVGRFEANAFGLYDTAGNVQEWVYDCFHPNYQGAPTDGSVWEGGECQYRIARGGAYGNPGKSIRPAKRFKWQSTRGYDTVGIRVARDVE